MNNHLELSWVEISNFFPNRTSIQCMHRWQKVLKPGLKKGKWSQEEDRILKKWVSLNGPKKWGKLSHVLNGRSSKQIRDRWLNNLNPERAQKFIWTEEIDKQLIIKYLELGSSWVQISKSIPFSTENMVKNRFYSMLRTVATQYNKEVKKHNKKILNKNKTIEQVDNLILDIEEFDTKKQKSKKNYSLSYLINFLPNLLEKKGIESIPTVMKDNIPLIMNEEKKNVLNSFFNKLSDRFRFGTNQINPKSEDQMNYDKSEARFKFKSTILLNLQLNLLHKIFEKCKNHLISRFFIHFKGCPYYLEQPKVI